MSVENGGRNFREFPLITYSVKYVLWSDVRYVWRTRFEDFIPLKEKIPTLFDSMHVLVRTQLSDAIKQSNIMMCQSAELGHSPQCVAHGA